MTRAPVLLQTAASADEGLFALVARELVRGHLPYTTVWETKPPLLFGLLALAFATLGTSTWALRIATDIAIFATAIALYAIGSSLRRDGRAVGLAAALLYAAMTLSDGASTALAETFYAPFVAIAIAIAVRRFARGETANVPTACGLGACLGCAVLVKESAALEAAFAAYVIVRALGPRTLVGVGCGFIATVALSFLPYLATHATALYWDANVGAVARRAFVRVTDATPPTDVLRAQALAFFPVTLLALGLPWVARRVAAGADDRRLVRLVATWAAVDLLTVLAIREFLGNHFIPMMAPAALAGSLVAVRLGSGNGARRAFVPALLAVALLAHCAYQFVLAAPIAYARIVRHDPTYGDATAELAAYLVAHASPGATLYVADDRTILYVLSGFASPTRYAYSAHLVDRYQETVAGVDGRVEVARILAGHPEFVVRDLANATHEDPRLRDVLDRDLARDYRPAFAVGTRTIYAYHGKS